MNKKIEAMVNEMLKTMEETKTLPWDNGFLEILEHGFPRNFVTRKPYRGFNLIFLAMCGNSETNLFLTFKQCQAKKGRVRKGSHGIPVTFFSWYNTEEKRLREDGDDPKDLVPFWRTYSVFKIEDTSLKAPVLGHRAKSEDWNEDIPEINDFAKAWFAAAGLKYEIVDKEETAWFSKNRELIHISKKELYHSAAEWYGTLLHEMVHSSMLSLKRDLCYDEEEIVAEFGSALLCAYFGISKPEMLNNNAVYLNSWSRKLKSNPEWLFHGAQRAQKAVDFMLEQAGLPSFSEKFADPEAKEEKVEG